MGTLSSVALRWRPEGLSRPVRPVFQVVALGDQHDTLRKCGRWMNAPRRASSMGSLVPQRFLPKKQYASREYESWQRLELFRPPFQIMAPSSTEAGCDSEHDRHSHRVVRFFLYEHADHGPTVSLTPRITPHTRERVVEDLPMWSESGSQKSIDGPGSAVGRGRCSARAVVNAG
jgi:hypothetical protein